MAVEVEDRPSEHRYALLVDGEPAGELTYLRRDDRLVLLHTGVDEAFQGRGLAQELVRRALADARSTGAAVAPRCPLVVRYLQRHPEDHDVVAPEERERLQP